MSSISGGREQTIVVWVRNVRRAELTSELEVGVETRRLALTVPTKNIYRTVHTRGVPGMYHVSKVWHLPSDTGITGVGAARGTK